MLAWCCRGTPEKDRTRRLQLRLTNDNCGYAMQHSRPPLGKLQKRIWRAFLVQPGALLTTTQLVEQCYPRIRDRFRNGHWYAVRRAAAAVAVPVGRSDRGRGRPLRWRAKRW